MQGLSQYSIWLSAVSAILACSINAAPLPAERPLAQADDLQMNYLSESQDSLLQITQRGELRRYIDSWCQSNPSVAAALSQLFMPPAEINDQPALCGTIKPLAINQERSVRSINVARPVPAKASMAWLNQLSALLYSGHPQRSNLPQLNPQQASFLHRSFARQPYLTALAFANVSYPLVTDEWRVYYGLLDRALQDSSNPLDLRMLVKAMLRDDRVEQSWPLLFELVQLGDTASLYLIEQYDAQLNAQQHFELTMPLLENYLINSADKRVYCQWAATITAPPLVRILHSLEINFAEQLSCQEISSLGDK